MVLGWTYHMSWQKCIYAVRDSQIFVQIIFFRPLLSDSRMISVNITLLGKQRADDGDVCVCRVFFMHNNKQARNGVLCSCGSAGDLITMCLFDV